MNRALAAVKDPSKHDMSSYRNIYRDPAIGALLDQRQHATAFNSGVLLFDLPSWRPGSITHALEEWTERLHGGSDADQSVFNLCFLGEFDIIDWRWNLQG